jgi:hypothetical protein
VELYANNQQYNILTLENETGCEKRGQEWGEENQVTLFINYNDL